MPASKKFAPVPATGLARFFEGLVHRSFAELSIWDRELAAYVVDLMVRFARTDALYRLRWTDGGRLETVVEFLIEAFGVEAPAGFRYRRELVKHIGDYTLFMSGIFRSYVERHDFLGFYLQEGGKAYREVARLDRISYRSGAALFEVLASEFENISGALDYMRRVYFSPAEEDSLYGDMLAKLLGQVNYN